jgi:hypothetical protein
MALPAKHIPESVAHLDIEIVAAALIRHDANIRNAARALDVPSCDLRKLVLVDQRLADAALEGVELKLDDAEANLSEALHCADPRRRDAVSMFMLRNVQRASKRGYAVAASATSLEVNVDAPPVRYTVRWMNECDSESSPESEADELDRDGRTIAVRRYGGDADPGEGMLATPPALIEAPFVELEAPSPVESAPSPPHLPRWLGPGGPPPLVAHLYQPSPRQLAPQPRWTPDSESPPQPGPWRRMSRGGYR